MASLDVSTVTAVLKEVYPNGLPKSLVYKNAPLLAVLPKDTEANGYGKQIHVPIRYGDPQGRSANFTKGRTAMTPSKFKAFDVTLVNDYGFCQVDGEVVDRMKTDRGSFIRAMKPEIDSALRQLRNSLVHALYRNGGGAIGRLNSTTPTGVTTATLATTSDIRFFSPGQILGASAADGTSGAQRAGTVTVSSVNRNTGVITASANWDTGIAAIAGNDYLFVDGDFGAKLSGLEAWVPASDPGATLFFGVDRTADVMRLGGIRQDYSSRPIEEAIPLLLERMAREDASTDCIAVHTTDWTNLAIALGSKVAYGTMEAYDDPKIGFKTISVTGPMGTVEILADPNCPPNTLWALQLDTWTLYSLGDIPKMLDNDGNVVLRNVTSDGVEAQLVYRAQIACDAPGWNGRFTIGS